MKNIALMGSMMAGKDTLASFFIHKYGYKRLAFADELKREICDILNLYAEDVQNTNYTIQDIDADKERFRPFLQWWATEFRRIENPDHWVNKLSVRIDWLKGSNIVVTDVRFINEINMLKNKGFIIVEVRPDEALQRRNFKKAGLTPSKAKKALSHVSEGEWRAIQPDLVVPNSIGKLPEAAIKLASKVGIRKTKSLTSSAQEFFSSVL